MKRIIVIFSLIGFSTMALAQIKVNSSGNVGIGTTNPTHKLTLVGASKFNNNVGIDWDPIDLLTVNIGGGGKINIHSWTPVYWDCTGASSAPCLYPSQTWNQQLGKSSYRIGQIWSHDIHCTDVYESSDIRLKTNVAPLESTLNKLMKLSSIQYTMNDESVKTIPNEFKSFYQRKQFGFSAQEVQKIFPELVHADSNGYLGIAYTRFIPLLVQTIKEQQQIIDAQSIKIKELDERLSKLENGENDGNKLHKNSSFHQDENTTNSSTTSNSFLYQNVPNPFSAQTEIKYFLTEDVTDAILMIFDMQGLLKKQITVQGTGFGSITIAASELSAGMYLYSLVANTDIIDTKKMILTK